MSYVVAPETAPYGENVLDMVDQYSLDELVQLRDRLTQKMREERRFLRQDPGSQFSGRRLKELSYQRDVVRSAIAAAKRRQ